MADVLKEIFGDTKRISILEELVERWGEFLTVQEIARMADVSPKATYTHINELKKIGILKVKEGKANQYKLKEDDKRAVALLFLENQEYLRIAHRKLEGSETTKDSETLKKSSFSDFYRSPKISGNRMHRYVGDV